MKLLQATWALDSPLPNSQGSGSLLVWGEHRFPHENLPETSGAPTHPYAFTEGELEQLFTDIDFEPDSYSTAEIYLPTSNSSPVLSRRFSNSSEDTPSSASLSKWTTNVAVFDAQSAAVFLSSIPDMSPPNTQFDDSLLFWVESIKLSLELLAQGKYVPSSLRVGETLKAIWYPIIEREKDQERFHRLSFCMPPASKCTVRHFETHPSEILETFLQNTIDGLARLFLSRFELIDENLSESISLKQRPFLRWILALGAKTPAIDGTEYELQTLEQQLSLWNRKSGSKLRQPAPQLLLKLRSPHEPKEDDEWTVHFVLRSVIDKNEELLATDLWQGSLGFLEQSHFTHEELEEVLLRELGKLVAIAPELSATLESPFPTQITLPTSDIYGFLRKRARQVESAGIVIDLPSWWTNAKESVGLKLSLAPVQESPTATVRDSQLGLNELLRYKWEIAVGDTVLSIDEFRDLVSLNTPLVQIADKWVELHPEKLKKTLTFLEQQMENAEGTITVANAVRYQLGLNVEKDIFPITGVAAEGWVAPLFQQESHQIDQISPPDSFQGSLRPYQTQGLSWLNFYSQLGIGCCLADDMGLGKTIQFLALILHERETSPFQYRPTLLVVPMSILDNWMREAQRFAPSLKVHIHHGTTRLTDSDFIKTASSQDIVVTTYSLVARDLEMLKQVVWNRVTLDEAQNIKNTSTKQSKAIRELVHDQMQNSVDGTTCGRIALTGTPLENRLDELWSIFDFLNPSLLGTSNDFRQRFALPIERYRDQETSQKLAKAIRPFILRRLKSDPDVVSDLPEKIEIDEITSLTTEQASLYQAIIDEVSPQIEQVEGIHRKGMVLAMLTKLKQVCDHPSLYLKDRKALGARSGKLNRLIEILEVLIAEGDRVLLFTQYAQMGHLLQKHLQEKLGEEVLFLHGALPRKSRDNLVARFQKEGGPKIFILSLKAGGLGLNLTAANQVVHYDQWWNPAVEEQATDRAYRIGQKRNVQVRRFITKGTLEEKINKMVREKRQLAREIVGSTREFITELSSNELIEFLKLSSLETEEE